MTDEQKTGTGRYFDDQSQRWPTLYASKPQFRDRLSLFVSTVQKRWPPPARVLDFGCGAGVISLQLARLGYHVVGTDIAPSMLRQAEEARHQAGLSHARFLQMDADAPVFAAGAFDVIVCSSVLQYLSNEEGVLASMSRVLRPGGGLVISVPNRASLIGKAEKWLAWEPIMSRLPGRQFLKYSLRQYAPRDFLPRLQSQAFGGFECTYFECPALGTFGIPLSRWSAVGVLLLVSACKEGANGTGPNVACTKPQGHLRVRRALSRKNLWENLPAPAKALAGKVLDRVKPSILLGAEFRRWSRFAAQAQHWSAEQAREYQTRELRRLCRHAMQRSPYYREVFRQAGFDPREIRQPEDLAGLPFIDRDTMREHLDRMCAIPPDSPGVEHTSTGGSAGSPLHFYIGTDRSAVEYAYLVASWQRVGYDLGLVLATLRGQVVLPDKNGLRHEYDPLLRRHCYSNFHMGDADLRRYLDHIATIGPCFLHVYPSSAATLARFVERTGSAVPANIRGILAGSENVYPAQREMVQRVLGRRMFSWYGHTEKLVLASECEHSEDYHVWPTYGYFELIDAQGRPVTTPGEIGEIVGTGFINHVVPFIRYRTGDYAMYVADHCSACGRQHPLIRDVRGHRTQEVLVAHDGSCISWTSLNMHDDTFAGVRQFQFRQDTSGQAVLLLVPSPGFDDDDAGRIRQRLGQKLEGRVSFTIELTDVIPLSPMGKAIYVQQRIAGLQPDKK